MIFYHVELKEYLSLITTRESGINTFLQVTKGGSPIRARRAWSLRSVEQRRLISDMSKMMPVI